MRWYLLSIGLFAFIIYRSTKSGINPDGTWNSPGDAHQKATELKTISRQDFLFDPNRSYVKNFRTVSWPYAIRNKSEKGIDRGSVDDNRNILLLNDQAGLIKYFDNGKEINSDKLSGIFFRINPY